jgi:hypothetical protein
MLSGMAEDIITCPSCNSTIVIEVDEGTLPTHSRNDQGEKQSFAIGDGPLSSGVNSSPSQSSIGTQLCDSRVDYSCTWKVAVCCFHLQSRGQLLACSLKDFLWVVTKC